MAPGNTGSALQQDVELAQELRRVAGLADVAQRPGFLGNVRELVAHGARVQHHGIPRHVGAALDELGQAVTREPGHVHVQKHEIGLVFQDRLGRSNRAPPNRHIVPGCRETPVCHFEHQRVVVDDHDFDATVTQSDSPVFASLPINLVNVRR
jgi:hypothetical protein